MNVRRQKLAGWIALQVAAAAPKDNHEIAELRVWLVREPVSGRSYTVVRLRAKSGLMGWGETGRVNAADVEKARSALGFEAAVDLRDGIRNTVEWTQSNVARIEAAIAQHREHITVP